MIYLLCKIDIFIMNLDEDANEFRREMVRCVMQPHCGLLGSRDACLPPVLSQGPQG